MWGGEAVLERAGLGAGTVEDPGSKFKLNLIYKKGWFVFNFNWTLLGLSLRQHCLNLTVGKSWEVTNSVWNTGTGSNIQFTINTLFSWTGVQSLDPNQQNHKLYTLFWRDQLMEEMEEAFSNYKVILNCLHQQPRSLLLFATVLTIFFAGSQWLEEHFQGCQHSNHHFHHVVRSLHFLTGRQH